MLDAVIRDPYARSFMAALEGKVIVIIGGTAGIGLAGARACLAAGANVVAVGRDDAALVDARNALDNSRSEVLAGDAIDPQTAERAIARAIERFNRFDGLYHVAGGSGRSAGDGPLDKISDAGWSHTLDLNLRSVFLSNRAALNSFIANNVAGSIVNVASVLAFDPSPSHFATHAYAAAKAGIIGLTRSAAAYYAPRGIRMNAIAPGLVDTPMARRAAGDERIQRFIATKQPLDGGRIGASTDFDAALIFFLSDASRFCTGQVLSIDGGWCLSDGQISPEQTS